MPKILTKRTSAVNDKFSLSRLAPGELGINTTDGRLYLRKGTGVSTDVVIEVGNVLDQLGFMPLDKAGDTMTGTLTLPGGTNTQAPLRLAPGVTMPTPVPHSLEWDGAFLYMTNNGGARKTVAYTDSNITGTSAGWTTARTIAFTGDVTGSFALDGRTNVSTALSLALLNQTPGTYGTNKVVPVITVNNKGIVTQVVNTPIALTTSDVAEGSNLYYFDSRARAAIKAEGDIVYNPVTGIISYTAPVPSEAGMSGDYNDLINRPMFTSVVNTSSLALKIIDQVSGTLYRGAKFLVCVTDDATNNHHATEIMVIHNGTDTFMNEYGIITTLGELGVFSSRLSGSGVMELSFTPATATSKTISVTRTIVLRG